MVLFKYFLNVHNKYPDDIIFGYSRFVLNKNYKFNKKLKKMSIY